MSGRRAEALELLNRLLSNRAFVSPFWVAESYVGLGDKIARSNGWNAVSSNTMSQRRS